MNTMIKKTWQIEALGNTYTFEAYEDPTQPGMENYVIWLADGNVEIGKGFYTDSASRRAMLRRLRTLEGRGTPASGGTRTATVIA
jgi:hypothetical protein